MGIKISSPIKSTYYNNSNYKSDYIWEVGILDKNFRDIGWSLPIEESYQEFIKDKKNIHYIDIDNNRLKIDFTKETISSDLTIYDIRRVLK